MNKQTSQTLDAWTYPAVLYFWLALPAAPLPQRRNRARASSAFSLVGAYRLLEVPLVALEPHELAQELRTLPLGGFALRSERFKLSAFGPVPATV